jgi:ribose 5-phosphate isomerase A
MNPKDQQLKEQAAREALKFVKSGMALGLGTGSTVKFFTEQLGAALKQGVLKEIVAVPTSEGTIALARQLGIPLGSLDDHQVLDLAVDGADEVDPKMNLIKGLGKALLREKMVEIHAKHFVVVVDESKMVQRLGTKCPLPVEIVQFGARATVQWLSTLGCEAELWLEEGKPAVTDNGNYLAKCHFKDGIQDAYILASELAQWPGIVEHGLFLDMAGTVITGTEKGPVVKSKK